MSDNKQRRQCPDEPQEKRPGEMALPFDPAKTAHDACVIFIGSIRSPWKTRDACPRNMAQARERGQRAMIKLDEVWREGLVGMEKHSAVLVLYWMDKARRDLIVQTPRHRQETHKSHKPGPRGVFSLRSPARPNPVAIATVRILKLDKEAGVITIDAIDCLDRTPLIDIKPWFGDIDILPE